MGFKRGHAIQIVSMGLLLMQLSSCIDFDTYVDNDDGRSDGGGTVLWQRSKIKTSAVRSFEHISNQTINLNSFKLDKDYVDNNNQHPAYQVPLQRLSNKQISYLLKKYSMKGTPSLHLNQMSKSEKMNMLQQVIADRAKIRAPVVLSQVRLPGDLTIQAEPWISESNQKRTTIVPQVKKITMPSRLIETFDSKNGQRIGLENERNVFQKEIDNSQIITDATETPEPSTTLIPEFSTTLIPEVKIEEDEKSADVVSEIQNTGAKSSEQLREISVNLRQMKEKYEAMKLKFLRRLRELNERKVKLATRRRLNLTTQGPSSDSFNGMKVGVDVQEPAISLDKHEDLSESQEFTTPSQFKPISKSEILQKSENSHSISSFAASDEDESIPVSSKILPDIQEPDQTAEQSTKTPNTSFNLFESFEKRLEQEARNSFEEGHKAVNQMKLNIIRPLKSHAKVYSSKTTSVKSSVKGNSRKGHFAKYYGQQNIQEVIPLVQKQDFGITPLNEFEEVTQPSRTTIHSPHLQAKRVFTSSLFGPGFNIRSLRLHANAYATSAEVALVKHPTSRIFSKAPKSSFVPKAKSPPQLDEKKEFSPETNVFGNEETTQATTEPYEEPTQATTEPYEETTEETADPYLRDGDAIIKPRHEATTEPYEEPTQETAELYEETTQATTETYEETTQATTEPYKRTTQETAHPYIGDAITKTRHEGRLTPLSYLKGESLLEQHPIPEHVDRDTDGEPSAEIPRSVMLEKIQQHDDHDLVHVDGDPEHVDRNTNEERHLPSDEISHSVIPEKLQENADEKVSSGNVTAIELVNKLHEVFDTSNVQTSDGSAKASGVKITDNDAEVEPNDLEEFAQTDEEAICDAVTCNFEKENLCEWEASRDLLSPASRHYLKLKRMMHRNKRRTHYIQRTWHNWRGRYRNRVTGIARARVFSTANQHFAAAYVRPFQRATLTGKLLSREQETIRFRAWEATRNVQLRVCCDSTENCVFETDLGIKRGTRRWMVYQATCPAGTSKIIFECVNHGVYQGACGLDDIHLLNDYCPRLFPIDEQRKRRKVKFAS